MMTPEQLKAQEEKLAVIEAKQGKMMDEYNHFINFKDDPLPVTNFSYRTSKSTKIASMRVTRNKKPLNYKIFDNFKLKELGFSEWLELHDHASKKKNASNDLDWVATTAGKLGIRPLSQLISFETTPAEKNRKRKAEVIQEVFVKENIMVDDMQRNLSLPKGVVGRACLLASTTQLIRIQNLINVDSEYAHQLYDELIYDIESRPDFIQAREVVAKNLDGMD
ncbi:hypothetical protein Tco_0427537 [Tanacetum coccineum]